MNNEFELIKNLKAGKKDAYDIFYNLYALKIYNLAYKILGNKDDSQDVLQNVFIQICNNIKNFREESKLYTWVYIITKNLCFQIIKNEGKEKSNFKKLKKTIKSANAYNDKEFYSEYEKNFYIEQIKEGCLLGLVRCLSFYQRISFILNVLYEIEVRDVAFMLTKSEGAIRTLLHRSKKNIKEFLCNNCSLYQKGNLCKCENMIAFSIKQNWINKFDQSDGSVKTLNVSPKEIEDELENFKKIIGIYKNMCDKKLPDNALSKIKLIIESEKNKIFSKEKVK